MLLPCSNVGHWCFSSHWPLSSILETVMKSKFGKCSSGKDAWGNLLVFVVANPEQVYSYVWPLSSAAWCPEGLPDANDWTPFRKVFFSLIEPPFNPARLSGEVVSGCVNEARQASGPGVTDVCVGVGRSTVRKWTGDEEEKSLLSSASYLGI